MSIFRKFVSILNMNVSNTHIKTPDKGDPSEIIQLFPKNNLQVLCCRFWWLKKWEFRELAFPYWRIYFNTKKGASLTYNSNTYKLDPDHIYLIAPNTSYATRLFDHQIPANSFALEGARIDADYAFANDPGMIEHLFIHFNMGMPYDSIRPGIFTFKITEHIYEKIQIIIHQLKQDGTQFGFHSFLSIQSLVSDLVAEIDKNNWNLVTNDHRILEVLAYIENNLQLELTNEKLAEYSHLATNSFTRLFSREIGVSPQRFVKKKRIDAACIQLHHSVATIDQIAYYTGFANRYHFTRIFTQITGLSPARYRKEFGIK